MREFFETLHSIDQIQALIDASERESDVLEYKSATALFDNRAKDEIAKDISGLANAGGGLVIYGVSTDPNDKSMPVAIDGLHLTNIETFDRVVNSKIRPPIKDIKKKLLPVDQPRVMAVYVPGSENPPHQSLGDHKYYRRAGIESRPMEHDLIAMYFGRRQGPILNLRFHRLSELRTISDQSPITDPLDLRILVENSGRRIARHLQVLLLLPSPPQVPSLNVTSGDHRNISQLYPERYALQHTNDIGVIHPGASASILEIRVVVAADFVANHHSDPFIEWTIFADEMELKAGSLSLHDLGWTFSQTDST
jgi:hypothetical protein